MKNLFRLLMLVFIISSCSKNNGTGNGTTGPLLPDTLSTGWTKITSLPKENFTDIFFVDNSNGYAVSNNGIYRSTNAGDEWTKLTATTATNFVAVAASNINNACFVNASFPVFVTQDGGNSIINSIYPYPGGGNVNFSDCVFSDGSTVFFSSNEFLWRSIDAGITLDTIYHFPNVSATSSLFFLNDQQGWVMRQDGIYKTTDAGTTWNRDTTLLTAYGSVDFIDTDNGYFSNYGTVNKTTDGGLTWQTVFQSSFQVYLDLDFIDTNEGYFNLGNKIYKTSDAGNTWTPVVALGNQVISKIHFTDVNHGWACTSDGTIVRYAP